MNEKIIEILNRTFLAEPEHFYGGCADQIIALIKLELPEELETKNIGNHYDLAQRNGYNLYRRELLAKLNQN